MRRGRPIGSKKTRTILLDYRSWLIYHEDGNYILRKKNHKNKHIAFHSTLESALQGLYDQMLLDYVNRKNNYGARFLDLANAIIETKKQIAELLSIKTVLKNSSMGVENSK